MANVLCSVVLGKQYHHIDPEFCHLLKLLSDVIKKFGAGGLVAFIPIMMYLLPWRYREIKPIFVDVETFTKMVAEGQSENRSSVAAAAGNDDETKPVLKVFIDVFLQEIERHTDDEDISRYINHESLVATTSVLFMAGTETSTTTLRWALLYMVTYPEVQAKVQQEMDRVVIDCAPRWSDRLNLPYTQAVLLEV